MAYNDPFSETEDELRRKYEAEKVEKDSNIYRGRDGETYEADRGYYRNTRHTGWTKAEDE